MSAPHAVSSRDLNLYLYPLAAWGVGLVGLYFADRAALALALCIPLALWMGAVTLRWGLGISRRLERGEVDRDQVREAVRLIAQTMAGAAFTPGIVFLAADPFAASSWGTAGGVAVVALASWYGVVLLGRWPNRYTYTVALTVAWLALPINATGSVSVMGWLGWFDKVL